MVIIPFAPIDKLQQTTYMQRAVRVGSSRRPFASVQYSVFRRCIHCSFARYAITNLEMPAMSPTMTEGGISQWKKKEGEVFSVGDVLLEIETDKATIDVEAQDDGVLGKILAPEGSKNLPVGRIIALLAEEGDDISNLQGPAEEPKSAKRPESSKPPPSQPTTDSLPPSPKFHSNRHVEHSRPLFPSVLRLLQANNIENPEKIKGTGVRGMLTKGDVLAHLGLASSPNGTYNEPKKGVEKVPPKKEVKPLDGLSVRRMIVSSLLDSSIRARAAAAPIIVADFNSIIADYIPSTVSKPSNEKLPSSKKDLDNDFDRLIAFIN